MAKKVSSSHVVTSLDVENFEGVKGKLEGVFFAGKSSAKLGGHPIFIGQIDVSDNLQTLSLLAHGTPPVVSVDSKDAESCSAIPTCPNSDEPLWKYVKRVKSTKTDGKALPIQSVYNRDTKPGHVGVLEESIERIGVDTKRRMVSFLTHPTTGQTHPVDGGHILTALSRCKVDADSILTIQVLCPIDVKTYADCLAGFDELQNARQVKDLLKAAGLCPGWDSEVQVVLNKLVLLLSGKGLDSSGSSLPHVGAMSEKTKKFQPRKLSTSEIAHLFTEKFPGVERLKVTLEGFNTELTTEADVDGKTVKVKTNLWEYPTFKKCKVAAWGLAIIECSYSTGLSVEKIFAAITSTITNDLDPRIAKLNSWATGAVEQDYPILCSIIFSLCGVADLPVRKPTSRSSSLMRVAYDAWRDKQ